MGEPSNALMEEMAKTEAERVAKQRELLGEAGLTEKATILEHATDENEVTSCKTLYIPNHEKTFYIYKQDRLKPAC